jgi:hypothetical protein
MTTSAKTGACYTCLVGATVLSEVRTISGLPARLYLENSILISLSSGFQAALENFGAMRMF